MHHLSNAGGFRSGSLRFLVTLMVAGAVTLPIGCTRQPVVGTEQESIESQSEPVNPLLGTGVTERGPTNGGRQGVSQAIPPTRGEVTSSGPDAAGPLGGTPAQNPASETSPGNALSLADQPQGRMQLASDLKPSKLRTFLSEVDTEMRMIASGQSGIQDEATAIAELQRIVGLKRAAATRLIEHPEATEQDRAIGRRGQLQSLSHLASMGNLRAAEDLQSLAERLKDDSDAEVRADSRLVLIGFAIESLRNGQPESASTLLMQIKSMIATDSPTDAASLMVMGQAKDALMQYQHVDEAYQVRTMIVDSFLDGTGAKPVDPALVEMAKRVAGPSLEATQSVARVQQLMQQVLADEEDVAASVQVTPKQWREAIQAMVDAQPDLMTTQYLAGASLETETIGREDLAEVTYQVLADSFADQSNVLGQEARTAIKARENRKSIIGQVFDPQFDAVGGGQLSLQDYRGKVVLMPFWSSMLPDSLLVVENLLEIANRFPNRVEVVGMNVDVKSTNVAAFVASQKIPFPSFRSVSDLQATIANPTAHQFGVVSLLFVAVIDADGRVAAIEFSGRDLTPVVENLLR